SRTSNFQIIFEYCRCPTVWIPACAGMTVERFQLLPINAAISNPVIPSKTEKQNQKPKIPSFPQLFVIPVKAGI
ncbi:hypothetical protein, partial [Neisseria meningitidis]